MRIIKQALLGTIAAIVCTTTAASTFDDQVLRGEWGRYESHWLKGDWYQYLKLSTDFGGTFAYYLGDKPVIYHFAPQDVQHLDGLLLVTIHRDKFTFRLALSGWRLASGPALMTGDLFMYQEQQGHEVLYNTIPLRLTPLKGEGPGPDEVPEARSIKERLAQQ